MCLHNLHSREKFQKVINHAKKDTLNHKSCLVGYKQFKVELKRTKPSSNGFLRFKLCLWNRYYSSGIPIKAGWQKTHQISVLTTEGTREAYANGFHVYMNKKQCKRLKDKTDWCVVVNLPVYFYEQDILVTGSQDISAQLDNGDWINFVIPTAVLDRYFIKKEDIQYALDVVFNTKQAMEMIQDKYKTSQIVRG